MQISWTDTKTKIEEWIGNAEGFLYNLSDDKAEKLLSWLEENKINIEKNEDMEKVGEFVYSLLMTPPFPYGHNIGEKN